MSLKISFKKLNKKEYDRTIEIYKICFTKKGVFTETEINFKQYCKILDKFPRSHATIKNNNEIIGEAWILPTNKKIMLDFFEEKINEEEMIFKTVEKVNLKNFNAIYIFFLSMLKDYRKKGLIFKALNKEIDYYLKINKKALLFTWPYSKGGENLALKISKEYKKPLILKK